MSNTAPEVGSYKQFSLEQQVTNLFGSFQGNGGASPLAAQLRGNWFSVAWIGLGQYRVTLTAQPLISLLGTATNNTGLLAEPKAWVVSESQTVGTPPAVYSVTQTTRVISAGTFDIFVYNVVGAALYNVTAADRVFFELGWKAVSFTP